MTKIINPLGRTMERRDFLKVAGASAALAALPVTVRAQEPVKVLLWSWVPDLQLQVDMFNTAHPGIQIELVNAGQGDPEYQAVRAGLQAGSGLPEIMERLFKANHLDPDALQLSNLEQAAAAEALQAGLLDAIVLASAPQSPQVQRLLRAPDIKLMDFGQADAYSRRFPFLSAVTLPRGVVDLSRDLPPSDVSLLAATTSLLSRDETHPALRQLFAQAAQGMHSDAGWFNRARDFPNTRTSELPVSPEGDRAINGTPPFWQRYLPFWASNLVERMWLVLGGLLVLMLPLSRIVPPLYQFRVRRRVFRWYARLREVEHKLEAHTGDPDALLKELGDLDRVDNKVAVPLSYADELYALRNNIEAVRRRVLADSPRAAGAGQRLFSGPA